MFRITLRPLNNRITSFNCFEPTLNIRTLDNPDREMYFQSMTPKHIGGEV
jgi:hypothetical protein